MGQGTARTVMVNGSVILFLGVLAIPVLFLELGRPQVDGKVEARVGVTAREMWLGDEWVMPTMRGKPRLEKPPVAYWLPHMAARWNGQLDEVTLRLPFAALAFGTLLLTYGIGALTVSRRTGCLAALILLTVPGFVRVSRYASADGVLLFAVAAALFFYVRARVALPRRMLENTIGFFGALALGCLAKGLVVLVFVLLPLVVESVWKRSTLAWRPLRSRLGIPLCLLIVLSWPVAVVLELSASGVSGALDIWWTESFGKIMSGDSAGSTVRHAEPWHFYLLRLPAYFGVWLLPLLAAAARATRGTARGEQLLESHRYLFLALGVPLLCFSAITEKKMPYLAPMFPVVAVIAGAWIELTYGSWQRGVRAFSLGVAGVATIGLLIVVAARLIPSLATRCVELFALPPVASAILNEHGGTLLVTLLAVVTGLWFVRWALRPGSPVLPTAILTATFAAGLFGYNDVKYSVDEDVGGPRADGRRVVSYLPGDDDGRNLIVVGSVPLSLLFYLGMADVGVRCADDWEGSRSDAWLLCTQERVRMHLEQETGSAGALPKTKGGLSGHEAVAWLNADDRYVGRRVLLLRPRERR